MKATVITVTLNNATTIRRTLQSVWTQKSQHQVEHIIVDGKSTDGTAEIITSSISDSGNVDVKFISETDDGLYYAMNKGLQLSTGDYVGFLNADDTFASPTSLDSLICCACRNDASSADVAYGFSGKHYRVYSSAHFKKSKMLMGLMPAHPTFYCKRSLLLEEGGFDTRFKIAADFELLLRLIYKRHIKVGYLPATHVIMSRGGITDRGIKSHIAILRDHYAAYIKNHIYSGLLFDALRYPGKLLEKC